MPAARLRLFEGKAEDSLPLTGRDRGFDRNLIACALMHAPTGAGLFAFGVLADA
jgi:hypothetical protein